VIQMIFLDSGPLSLLTQRHGVKAADECRSWMTDHLKRGTAIAVPEIVDYELRRELIRSGKTASISRLDALNNANPNRYVPLTTVAMRVAAQLWAEIRNQGLPTTNPLDIDVDVILAAQALTSGLPQSDFMIATTNPSHLSRFAPAELWTKVVP
jgi:predicted nucleic acid-binding protein